MKNLRNLFSKRDRALKDVATHPVRNPLNQESYRKLATSTCASELFDRLLIAVIRFNDESRSSYLDAPTLTIEKGCLSEGRRYLFVKPWHSDGYLLESHSHGWLMSQAHRIVSTRQFIRESEPVDAVTVMQSDSSSDLPRLSSKRFEDEGLLSYLRYESLFINALRKKLKIAENH